MVKESFVADFTGVLSRYKNWTFTKPCPQIDKGVTYVITIAETGKVSLIRMVLP